MGFSIMFSSHRLPFPGPGATAKMGPFRVFGSMTSEAKATKKEKHQETHPCTHYLSCDSPDLPAFIF